MTMPARVPLGISSGCSEKFSVFCGTAAPAVVLRKVECRAGTARHNYFSEKSSVGCVLRTISLCQPRARRPAPTFFWPQASILRHLSDYNLVLQITPFGSLVWSEKFFKLVAQAFQPVSRKQVSRAQPEKAVPPANTSFSCFTGGPKAHEGLT